MNGNDEAELERLVEMLRRLDAELAPDAPSREALQKAALALRLAFIHGLKTELEDLYTSIDKPLTEAQRQHLRSIGVEPPAKD